MAEGTHCALVCLPQKLPQQPTIEPKEDPKTLRDRQHHLPMRHFRQQLLLRPLRPQQLPLTGRVSANVSVTTRAHAGPLRRLRFTPPLEKRIGSSALPISGSRRSIETPQGAIAVEQLAGDQEADEHEGGEDHPARGQLH
jgi:hypothetical protein